MKRLVLAAALLALLALSLTAAACGNEVPAGAIAAVGDGVVTQEQFDALMDMMKARYKAQQGAPAFPEEGTPQYNQIAASIVAELVQRELIKQKAEELDVSVSQQDLDDYVKQVEQSVGGKKKLDKVLKQYGMTMDQLLAEARAGLLMEDVKAKVYEDVEVSDEKVKEYFENPDNASQFEQPATRDMRHVLTKTKEQAEEVRALLAADSSDANWKKVAKKYSIDPSKDSGGSLGSQPQGQMVPAFDKAAWSLDVDEISVPVKTQFGWHVIQVTKVTPAKKQTFDEAKTMIQQTLLYQEQATAWNDWLEQAKKDADVVYAAGFDPDKLTATPSPAETAPAASPSPSKAE